MGRKNQFSSDHQPVGRKPRGKDKRTLILEALERAGVTEEGFYDRLITAALGENQVAFQELWKRFHPIPKQVAPTIDYDYPADGTLADRSRAIERGIAAGVIPPDIGVSLISALSGVAKIEEVTEVIERISKIEAALSVKAD